MDGYKSFDLELVPVGRIFPSKKDGPKANSHKREFKEQLDLVSRVVDNARIRNDKTEQQAGKAKEEVDMAQNRAYLSRLQTDLAKDEVDKLKKDYESLGKVCRSRG